MARFKYMGKGETRCRVSSESGDNVKVVEGEVINVELGSHPELTEAYFERGQFVRVEDAPENPREGEGVEEAPKKKSKKIAQ